VLADPLRKDVAIARKKIDMANKELKPLGQSCQKKVQATVAPMFCMLSSS